ncbi:MAG: diguanylate cyclase, partial [Armatimonadetes bacterium]|nr:diguanylate cyclase [Armatimonadota bacterium]
FVFIFKSYQGFIDLLIKVGNKIIMGKELNLEEEKKLNKLKEIFNKLSFIIKSKRERELNDLSKLPGNKELEEILYKYIDSKEKFAVALVNINNLTSYNHKYGFEKGDSVIRLTSIIIINKVKEFGNKEDFIAHLGSDQFVFITTIDKVDLISEKIIQSFDEHILFFYEKEDREKGYILSKNRKGEIIKAQVINLSIAACTNGKKPLIHPFQIGQLIKEIGEYLKQERGSGYLKDRRLDER